MLHTLKNFWPKKWPSKSQWKKLPEVLNKKEIIFFLLLVVVCLFSFFYTSVAFYQQITETVPAHGGSYREGIVQSTRFLTLNPLYSSQSEVERDIVEVLFAGLMCYDKEGNIVPHLAEKYETEEGRTFDVTLRENTYWSDGEKISADDVLFTIKTIQNADFQSNLRQQWMGVDVEKLSDKKVRFILDAPSSVFLENLTLKIIPMHIFEGYSPRDFRFSIYNMQPVSSGPYRFQEIKEGLDGNIDYLKLERNPHYFGQKPFLEEVSFFFYRNVEDLLRAQRRGEIEGFTVSDSLRSYFPFEEVRNFNHHKFLLPRYFSIFFNLQSEEIIKEVGIRKALSYAINKEELIEEVLDGDGVEINSPLLLDFYGIENIEEKHAYNPEKAKELLREAGFENGKREVEDPFSFTKDLKMGSQGEEVRNLQRCFLYLGGKNENLYPDGEVTGFFDEEEKEAVVYFQEKYREEILDPHNFKSGTGMVAKSTRKKLNEVCEDLFNETVVLEIKLTTLDDPMLEKTANLLKKQWADIGIKTTLDKKNTVDLKEDVIRPRDFELLLFGTMLTGVVNPLPLWHSTKIDDPGINISGYENESADELLEKIISGEEEEKEKILLDLQEIITSEVPGIFLYNPYFNYFISEKIKGVGKGVIVNSSKRFKDIDRWFINTKRVLKR